MRKVRPRKVIHLAPGHTDKKVALESKPSMTEKKIFEKYTKLTACVLSLEEFYRSLIAHGT